MRLDQYKQGNFKIGRSIWIQALWYFLGQPLFGSYLLHCSSFKVSLLRLFGASIDRGVVIKPGVKVKYPWRLKIGAHTWIGECTWIDNLADVEIGSHSCISQGVYLCTGSHRWDRPGFDLEVKPINIGNRVWIAAKGLVAPGCTIADGAVLTLGSTAQGQLKSDSIYSGAPAQFQQARAAGES